MKTCSRAKPGLTTLDVLHASGLLPKLVAGLEATLPSSGSGGAWACHECGNVNWPSRTACNGKNGFCGVPRPPSIMQADSWKQQLQEAPEGSWTCALCQNVNWPQRTICNRKDCAAPQLM